MIIIINSPNRNDKEELSKNASYLKSQLPYDEVVRFKKGLQLNSYDYSTKLDILAHGSPKELGGMSPNELATAIGSFINQIFKSKGIAIQKINLYACNTGNEWKGEKAYAAKFAEALSHVIAIDETIEVRAPNGIVAFYPNGETVVIADADPFVRDDDLMNELAKINLDDLLYAKNKVQHLLVEDDFSTFTAVSIKNYFAALCQRDSTTVIQEDEGRTPSVFRAQNSNTFFMSSKTYNWFTEKFAALDSKDETTASTTPQI